MKRIRSLPKLKLLAVCMLLFSFFLVQQSCTKINTDVPGKFALTDAEATQKFFALPANASLAVRRTVEKMKQNNAASEFVKSFIKNNGYPVWDKVLIPAHNPVVSNSFGNNNAEGSDTVVIIPVVPQDTAVVTGFIKVTLNGTVYLDFYRGSDYAAYSFNEVPADSINADKAAMQMMLLNNYVFGYKEFKLSDNRLFTNRLAHSNAGERRAVLNNTTVNNLTGLVLCTNVCIYQLCPVCGFMSCPLTTSICYESCVTVNPGGGGGGSTGGGGGGDPTPPPGEFPCAGSQAKGIGVASPCGGGPTGPPPVFPVSPPKPCVTVTNFFQIPNVGGEYQNIRGYASGNTEMGYAFNTTGNGALSTGVPDEHKVEIGLVANCIGYLHCHNPGCDYYLFSCEDIEQIYRNVAFGRITDNATIGLIAFDGTPYMLTIQDKAAFLSAMSTFIENEPDEQKREEKYSEYFKGLDTPGQKEMGFLKFMGDINAGIGLIKANNFLNEFTELKLSSDGADVIEIPCNPS